MTADTASRLALKERLQRTWPAFFERHGNFTDAQVVAMPPLLDGRNVVVVAPTAGGKTEAALAPLVERHCPHDAAGPVILYLAPTKALVNDLCARLEHPLRALDLSLGVRTGDRSTWRPARPPRVLITTPESADALLAARARMFANLRAIVVDELHLLDGTPRGDQLRVVLNRLRRIRAYASMTGAAPDAAIQYAALSATIDDPAGTAARYFPDAVVARVSGTRAIHAEQIGLPPHDTAGLHAYIATFRARRWRKALAFCNSRAEVEAYAATMRDRPPFGDAVYVHYSNIEATRRREIEERFAHDDAAICFASSTLELGIDIGDIDVVILLGPPGNSASFLQRIGRGNRRRGDTRVACFWRTPLERLLFDALLSDPPAPTLPDGPAGDRPAVETVAPACRATGSDDSESPQASCRTERAPIDAPFHTAVVVQQIFSLIKQSPTGAVRLAELAALFEGMLAPDDVAAVLGQLQQWEYLTAGRPGEWRAWTRLNDLIDLQGRPDCSLSLYSNVQGAAGRTIEVRDSHTHRALARVDAQWLSREIVTLEGRPVNVEWSDGEAIWVSASHDHGDTDSLSYRSERQLLAYELAARLPAQLGLPRGAAPFIPARDPASDAEPGAAPAGQPESGWWWFHWLGDLYGHATLGLLRYRTPARETAQPGLCVFIPDEPRTPPSWSETLVTRYVEDNYRGLEALLSLGPFHRFLPAELRRRTVVEQFDVPRFLDAVAALRPAHAPDTLTDELADLLKERDRR